MPEVFHEHRNFMDTEVSWKQKFNITAYCTSSHFLASICSFLPWCCPCKFCCFPGVDTLHTPYVAVIMVTCLRPLQQVPDPYRKRMKEECSGRKPSEWLPGEGTNANSLQFNSEIDLSNIHFLFMSNQQCFVIWKHLLGEYTWIYGLFQTNCVAQIPLSCTVT